MRKIDATSVIVGAVLTAAAAVGLYFFVTADAADDEDRSVIIVRGGSVELLQEKSKDWKWDSAGKQTARPDHPKGGSVIGFMVTFDSTDTGGTASGCPALPVVGSSVDFEYKSENDEIEHVTIGAVLTGPKNEPVISAPKDMTLSANKKELTYGTKTKGSILSVTVNYGTTATQKCTPNNGKLAGEVHVKPLR